MSSPFVFCEYHLHSALIDSLPSGGETQATSRGFENGIHYRSDRLSRIGRLFSLLKIKYKLNMQE